jgi:GTP-binding protein
VGSKPFLVVDTGGLEPHARSGIFHEMARQAMQAVDEADVVLFLVDGRDGLTPADEAIARELRRRGKRLTLVVNKSEGRSHEAVAAEFHALGLGEPVAISAAHGDAVDALIEAVLQPFPAQEPGPERDPGRVRIAVVGRPNVGKSTLVNALLGEERVIAFDQPGTTRDSIHVEFERGPRRYTLIDTAGLRRRGKVEEAAEKFSVLKTLQAIEDAHVAILLLDARQDVADQDAQIAGFILEAGRALVVAVNKWDGLAEVVRQQVKRDLERKLSFLEFARTHFVSALTGHGLTALLHSVDQAYAAAMMKLPTPKLTRALIDATSRQPPPRAGLFRPKLRYAHQGGSNPPIIVIHGTQLGALPDTYRRYLSRCFAETFKLEGTPLRLQFKVTENPYARRK